MARSIRLSVLLVGCVLFASSSNAAPRQEREPSSALVQIWNQLAEFWSDIGCIMDPSGLCRERAEIGCGMDPDGHCGGTKTTPTRDSGCIMDPGGACRETAARDIGCIIDPSGGCGSMGRGQLDPNG
jgi:hypothetical protein